MGYTQEKIASTYKKFLNGTKYQFDSENYMRTGKPGIVRKIRTTLSMQAFQQANVRKYNYIGFHFYYGEKTKEGYPIMFSCTNSLYLNAYDAAVTEELFIDTTNVYVKRRTCNALIQYIKDCPTYLLTQIQQNTDAFTDFAVAKDVVLDTLKQEVLNNAKS